MVYPDEMYQCFIVVSCIYIEMAVGIMCALCSIYKQFILYTDLLLIDSNTVLIC